MLPRLLNDRNKPRVHPQGRRTNEKPPKSVALHDALGKFSEQPCWPSAEVRYGLELLVSPLDLALANTMRWASSARNHVCYLVPPSLPKLKAAKFNEQPCVLSGESRQGCSGPPFCSRVRVPRGI